VVHAARHDLIGHGAHIVRAEFEIGDTGSRRVVGGRRFGGSCRNIADLPTVGIPRVYVAVRSAAMQVALLASAQS